MDIEIEKIKVELAEAYAKQVRLEMQLKHKEAIIVHLKEALEHQRNTIKGLQEESKELMTEIGKLTNSK
jgi:uncharacterized coiled-coil protein SlyX